MRVDCDKVYAKKTKQSMRLIVTRLCKTKQSTRVDCDKVYAKLKHPFRYKIQ